MANSELGDRVKDMYDGVDLNNMTKRQKEAHIDRTLQNNRDVLLRVYRQDRLHMVFLRPTDPGVWMRVIQGRIATALSFQLTKKRAELNIYKITMSGAQEALQGFCNDFDEIYEEVMRNMPDEGAAAGNNAEDDVEELRSSCKPEACVSLWFFHHCSGTG
ncbi:hypothetical protein KOW79_003664 [Hemibagrus wyckioides]|uniref:Uncharacterized protein n=1 Tax=Hemibagrus wyckioides TaxID=337641 RepID=A0A9D3SVQ2_9TELE|nr:hypothetical protein KOW79_003664 [Hemibagrus wyckioides]